MSKYQYRIEPDNNCESPREFGLAEVWSEVRSRNYNGWVHKVDKNWHFTADLAATIAELQDEGYVCLEFTGMVWGISAVTLAKEFASKEQALECLQAEHAAYIAWRSGECYRYVIYEVQKCNLGHEHEVEIDSCAGFYGYSDAVEAATAELKERG